MTPVKAIGKFLDQPILTAKINKYIPPVLASGSCVVIGKTLNETPSSERKKEGGKLGIILGSTILSAIFAPKIASKITGRNTSKTLSVIKDENSKLVDTYISEYGKNELSKILEKSKTGLLSPNEISILFNKNKDIGDKLIPPPDNIKAKDIFKEIGWLSIFGAVPVAGGIVGGIAADRIYEKKEWKNKVPDKVNEGIYQYLANIFLCNIGAGIALGILEKLNIKSKMARCIGMVAGILLTGVIGGSVMANYIGNKLINPVIFKDKTEEKRTPELLDLSLHTDDIATVSLLSGLKWIEPSLPILYSISGYRAGIGYRNDKNPKSKHIKVSA